MIGVGSGKGGVGKTTVTVNLALALAARGARVGVFDADLYGPNLPLMLGITKHTWTESWTLARNVKIHGKVSLKPVERHGLKVVSAGFILGEDQPLGVGGTGAVMLIRQLLTGTDWGELDWLLVDLPPGTSEIQQTITKNVGLTGAVVVVTPQYVAHLDAKKAVGMYRLANVPVLGAVENMAGQVCPHCGERFELFPPVPEARALWSMGVERLGSVPVAPQVSLGSDRGTPVVLTEPDSAAGREFAAIAERLARD